MYTQQLIERYKLSRRKKFLDKRSQYKYQYAFIGVGGHSTSNLYPVIQYLGIPLKKIFTRHIENAQKMAKQFAHCTGTDNLIDILDDPAIRGVFVSTPPEQHFGLVSQLLQAGKQVFVEKPPCYSLAELRTLIQHQQGVHCQTGLQRRFSTINQLLKPFLPKAKTYSYRYLTGAYPEGNPLFDLYIHPIDNILQLFGTVKDCSIHYTGKESATFFIRFTHTNHIQGMLQLSTDFSWQYAVDEMEINTTSGILQAHYPYRLTGIQKPVRFLNLPLEKILKTPMQQKIYLDTNAFGLTAANNSLALQGFVGELEHFVKVTEQDIGDEQHQLQSLLGTYEMLEKMKQAMSH